MSEITQPIPLYECDIKVGDQVRLAEPDGGYDPDEVLHVLGVEWRHQRGRADSGWNITVASADDIAKEHGATDGYRPEHLIPARRAARPAPEAGSVVELIRNALQFSVWAAGEGLTPQESHIAAPEDFLCDYSTETGDEDWDGVPNRVTAAFAEREERIERLERDVDRERENIHTQQRHIDVFTAKAERLEKALRELRTLFKDGSNPYFREARKIIRAALQQEGESDE